jgi:hypothetical protein
MLICSRIKHSQQSEGIELRKEINIAIFDYLY